MRHVVNFSPKFAPLVESSAKRQTIRKLRKRPIKPGDTLRLYTGMRTKACRLLGEAVCADVASVSIYDELHGLRLRGCIVDTREEFAAADGFASYAEMLAWFERTHGLPFAGVVIRWSEIRR